MNPNKLIANCKVVIHYGFDSTWDRYRSLLNPDRLMDDCDIVLHDGLDCTSPHAKYVLNPVRLMADYDNDTHALHYWMSNHPRCLLKPQRATRFCVAFTQVGMESRAVGIVGLSRGLLCDPGKVVCLTPSSKMAIGRAV